MPVLTLLLFVLSQLAPSSGIQANDPAVDGYIWGRDSVVVEGRSASRAGQAPAAPQPSAQSAQVVDTPVCALGAGGACAGGVGCGDEHVLYARSSFTQLAADARRQLDDLAIVCRPPAQESVYELVVAEFYRHTPQVPAPSVFPSTTTLCNLDTVYWSTATNYSIPTSVVGQQVTIFLTPTQWVFDLGETSKTHPSAGKADAKGDAAMLRRTGQEPSRRGYFTHRYAKTTDTANAGQPHQLTVTVTYTATFQIGTGIPETIPGSITGTSPASPLTVKQARAQLVDPHSS